MFTLQQGSPTFISKESLEWLSESKSHNALSQVYEY